MFLTPQTRGRSQVGEYIIYDALLNKAGQAFWLVWNSKFRNMSPAVIQVDGTYMQLITLLLSTHLQTTLPPTAALSTTVVMMRFKLPYQELREQYTGYPIVPWNLFDVELINNLMNKMDNRKAAGLDDLTSEHLKFSHPIVVLY